MLQQFYFTRIRNTFRNRFGTPGWYSQYNKTQTIWNSRRSKTMVNNKISTLHDLSSSDRAVSGLLRGLIAGLVMAGILIPVGLAAGDTWLQAINRFNPFGLESPLQGLLLHVGISAVYGIVFGLLQPLIPRRLPGWLAGLCYGLLLFCLAEYVILPRTGSGLADLPALALLIAHGIYGLVLGLRS
jgi:hypothetical protein